MHHQTWALAGLAISSLLYTVTAQELPEIVFDCSVTPGACTNMCWGAYCSGYDVTLSYDKPSASIKRGRREKAGCGRGNRCGDSSPDPDGSSCDEYPFASVEESDHVQQVNRCIPPSEQQSAFSPHVPRPIHKGTGFPTPSFHQSKVELLLTKISCAVGQGGTLSQAYQNDLNNAPGQFIVGFGNPDDPAVQYCDYDQDCLNDGNQYLGDDLAPDGPQVSKKHKRNFYMLESGVPFLSTRELGEGSKVRRVVKRSEAEMTLMRRGGGNPFDLVDDTVKGRVEH